jgi:surfeit locus 1 family protein
MRRHLSLILGSLVALVMILVLLGLGTWQMQRLHWKQALIAERTAALDAPAISLEASDLTPDRLDQLADYRRVSVTGSFLNDHEFYLASQVKGDLSGWHVITPLKLADGSAVLVDRGFVPDARKPPESRKDGLLSGTLTITGILHRPRKPGSFTPPNEPANDVWYTIDPAAMAGAAGLATLPAIVIDAGKDPVPGGYPVGGQTVLMLDNPHLQYAITWYGLAGLLLVTYLLYCRRYFMDYRARNISQRSS